MTTWSSGRLFCRMASVLAIMGCAVLLGGCAGEVAEVFPPAVYKDAIVLDNGQVTASISLRIGRIVTFGRSGGENMLWLESEQELDETREFEKKVYKKQWMNYGGDKIWPAQQTMWLFIMGGTWPPDLSIDGPPWRLIRQNKNSLVIESPTSKSLHVTIRREITLAASEAKLVIRNTMTRSAPSPFPVQIWSITQMNWPEYSLLGVDQRRDDIKAAYTNLHGNKSINKDDVTEMDRAIQFAPERDLLYAKIGTLGRWVAAVFEKDVFVQDVDYVPGACYVDGSSVQFYKEEKYVELETLSPCVHLKPGESLSNVVTWRLIERPAGAPAADIAAKIQAAVK